MTHSRPRVLYIAYWGAAEPLGQSLVLPAIKKLARAGVRLVLVTFEKAADLDNVEEMTRIRKTLAECDVPWIPLRYHKRPKVPATAFDIAQGWARSLLTTLDFSFNIVHARTYIGGLMGLAIARTTGARYIFHNEGFYPDEQVDGGVWKAGSLPHRIAKSLEQRMYAAADGIITLSERARQVVADMPAPRRRGTPTIVVPSCVDLERFSWEPNKHSVRSHDARLVYLGSIGQRYAFDHVARFVAIALQEFPGLHWRILTRSEPGPINANLHAAGMPKGAWSIASVSHEAIPAELRSQRAGISFLTRGLSEHGGSPTKVGEYWASGLPVITTPNVSDTDEIIRRHRVGVIVHEHSEIEYRRAARELRDLLDDADLPRRCRTAAETYYNLDDGCEHQMKLYRSVLHGISRHLTLSPRGFSNQL